jgi:AraC-like DNA-binding protein/mannose-6-phosphate isomerase-like protein (cupin superfamily)
MSNLEETKLSHLVLVNDKLEELRQHSNIDFPFAIYPLKLSEEYHTHIRWHWHNELELIYVATGEANFFVGEVTYNLHEGQGLIINTNTLHSIAEQPGKSCLSYSIVFHPSVLLNDLDGGMAAKYLTPLFESKNFRYLMLDNKNVEHRPLLAHIAALIDMNPETVFAYPLQCKIRLLQFWVLLLKYCYTIQSAPDKRNPQKSLDESRVKEAISYIETNYADPITLDDIASVIHISTSECCRCFKRCINLSPFEYLMRCRIYMATKLMQDDPEASISSIAIRTGFNSSSYFNKLFRKYMNCTPSEFRKTPLGYQPIKDQFLVPFT